MELDTLLPVSECRAYVNRGQLRTDTLTPACVRVPGISESPVIANRHRQECLCYKSRSTHVDLIHCAT